MDTRRVRLVLVPGGRLGEPEDGAPGALPREALRVIRGGPTGDVATAIKEAIEAARQMRLEIEQRIARALDAFDEKG